jgi:prephenate dehydratase
MSCIATLGPASTFSEIAAQKFIKETNSNSSVSLYPTIKKVFDAVNEGCEIGVVPMENMAEGYVQQTLDFLLHSGFVVIHELLLPIQFSFAANCSRIEQVDKIYAQFVTQGQCCEFLDNLQGIEIITTQSNGTSLEQLMKGIENEGAIIPKHTISLNSSFSFVIDDVTDYKNNQTRFIVFSSDELVYSEEKEYKTSIVIVNSADRPGVLSEILNAFAEKGINLVSIISRPTKTVIGKYHFFVDIEGHYQDPCVKDALDEIREHNEVNILGSFPRAEQCFTGV